MTGLTEVLAMKQVRKKLLFWAPRILCILFALFVSVFAFDVFSPDVPFGRAITGFLVHLIPVYLLIGVLILAWRWEWIGVVGTIILSALYIFMTKASEHWLAYLSLIGPMLLIGLLFLFARIAKVNSRLRKDS